MDLIHIYERINPPNIGPNYNLLGQQRAPSDLKDIKRNEPQCSNTHKSHSQPFLHNFALFLMEKSRDMRCFDGEA